MIEKFRPIYVNSSQRTIFIPKVIVRRLYKNLQPQKPKGIFNSEPKALEEGGGL